MAKGCLIIFGVFLAIVAICNWINELEEEQEPKAEKYWRYNGYTGMVDSVTITDEGIIDDFDPQTLIDADNYYPTREMDSSNPDNRISGTTSEWWHNGFEIGSRDGAADYLAGTPFKSYDFDGLFNGSKGADYKLGYWQGYSKEFHGGLKKPTTAEVLKMMKEQKVREKQSQPGYKPRPESYERGYHRGYVAGEEDAMSKAGYSTSYDDSNDYRVSSARRNYCDGYANGYEDGFNDNQ